MTGDMRYRTLFVGTLVQDSFLTLGGTDDPFTTVDSPFCRDGEGRPTLRGSSCAGALIATLRRLRRDIPAEISGSEDGRVPSVWRFFNAHPLSVSVPALRQHVAIDARTGAAMDGALFNVETMPPGTRWQFLLEVDTRRHAQAADLARQALSHWAAGRCVVGGEVARGLGWMTLEDVREYTIDRDKAGLWPHASASRDYPRYIRSQFGEGEAVAAAPEQLPGWQEYDYLIHVGERADGYGIDSLSIGTHASEGLAIAWDDRFLDRQESLWRKGTFDPDFAVVTFERDNRRYPYIPGSSLRGPLRHAFARRHGQQSPLVASLFGKVERSAKLLFRDAFPRREAPMRFAWMQHHAEDEFAGGAYGSAKFDRIAVMQGSFEVRMVLDGADEEETAAFRNLLELAHGGEIATGGGQWRGHGWLRWEREDRP